MSAKYILAAAVGTGVIAYAFDNLISDQKIFGGSTPSTVSNKEWWQETDKSSRHGLELLVPQWS